MNIENMTQKLQEALLNALNLCKDNNNPELCSEHMLSALIDDPDINGLLV